MLDAYVYDAVRTPRGTKGLADVRPVELVGALLEALGERGLDPSVVDDLILGCNTQTGDQGANIAKTAALWAGWPDSVSGMTTGSFCISGLDALAAGAARVAAGIDDVVVAGGVESMSRVPMLSDGGAWFADPEVAERTGFVHMGVAADRCAAVEGFTRADLDEVALRSHQRAAAARDAGRFDASVVPVASVTADEGIRESITADKLAGFDPVFGAFGSETPMHTVATSPQMVDAASAVVVGRADAAERMGQEPRARIAAVANVSVERDSLIGTVDALAKALAAAGMSVDDLDVVEANESFAAPVLAFSRRAGVDWDRLNRNGGALAMGHPLGATGGILLATALDELERIDGRTAAVTIPAGAGLAAALILTRP